MTRGPATDALHTAQNDGATGRRAERYARKRALGRTRGHAAGLRVAAGAREASKLFRPVTLSRRQALAAAAGAAATGSLAAMSLGDKGVVAAAANKLSAGAAGTATSNSGAMLAAANNTAAKAPMPKLSPVTVSKKLTAEHLLRRVTYAPTPAMRAEVAKLGISNWLALQLAPSRIPDPLGDKVSALYPRLKWSISRVHAMQKNNDKYYEFLYEVGLQHLGRAIWSKRQLNEIMVEFWSDHLNVPAPADKGSYSRHRYDADVIRKHALGRFEDMLVASSTHPSMLAYLDNELSTKQQPNENYARELMELHTLGVNGGYTEKDVKQAALLLTGWETPWDTGVTRYVPSRHYTKPVRIMGRTIANGTGEAGRIAQQRFVRWLAMHPSTANHICRKLAIRFVSDNPSAALVKSLAATYLRNKTSIAPVLRQLFASAEFASSGSLKMRRPFERIVAVVRTLDAKYTGDKEGLMQLYWMTQSVGHVPMAWPTPDGYPDLARKWQSPAAALEMINHTSSLVHAWWPNKIGLPGPKKLLPKPPGNRAASIDAVSRKVLGRLPTAQEKAALNTLLASTKLPRSYPHEAWAREETGALAAIMLMTSPTFLSR